MTNKEFHALVCPKVDTSRGAPMGRNNVNKGDGINYATSKRAIRINAQGYDPGGAYWGVGGTLYAKYSKCGGYIKYIRNH